MAIARAKPTTKSASPFSHIKDPELRRKLEAVASEHKAPAKEIPPEVDSHPRFVFSRATPDRSIGAMVQIRNGLDESNRGGTIIEPIGRAYRVDLGGDILIVHEPEDSWE